MDREWDVAEQTLSTFNSQDSLGKEPEAPDNPTPCILVIESDMTLGSRLSKGIKKAGAKVILAHSSSEAFHLLSDLAFIGCRLDAILASYRLRTTTGDGILHEFGDVFPKASVALMLEAHDLAVSYWAKPRGIRVLHKPIRSRELSHWLATI